MSVAPKRFKTTCVRDVYQASYETKYDWATLLPEEMFHYFELFQKAFNCPMSVSVPSIISMIAAICGPKTKMEIRNRNFIVPLNTYTFIIASPGGGKSSAYSKIVEPVLESVEESMGATIGVETYTVAGLQRLHLESQGRALLVSDEGHRVLSTINAKQNRCEGERALLNKMWGGKGDSSCLLEKQRGFKETSFSMLLYIQPGPLLSELSQMGVEDGFLDRMLFFSVQPMLHMTKDITRATEELNRVYGEKFLPEVLMKIFESHRDQERLYQFSSAAQEYYDALSDEHAQEFNRRYDRKGIASKLIIKVIKVKHIYNIDVTFLYIIKHLRKMLVLKLEYITL